jgi:competence protein ComFC
MQHTTTSPHPSGSHPWYHILLDSVFPPECLHCATEGDWLCKDCLNQTILIKSPTCPFCDRLSPLGKTCPRCKNNHALFGCRSIWHYTHTVPSLIRGLKYKGIKSSKLFITPYLADLFNELPLPKYRPILITSIPSPQHRIIERGFNQSELLAKDLASYLNLQYCPLLKRNTQAVSQTKLSRKERLANAKNQFSLSVKPDKLPDYTIVIVDDVITTGATLSSTASALKQGGAKQVWALTVAKD